MTKYVVSGYIGFDNFGDEAIAGIVSENLKQMGADKITFISSNPEKTAKLYGVNSCGMLKFFHPILETDILISGGGSLLQDVTSLKSLIYYLLVIYTALFFRKKVIIFAQGFTPFRTKLGEILTKSILKKCHKITVRDKKSQELLAQMGINSELTSDPVFGIQVPNIEKSGIGVQLRNCEGLTDEFLEKLALEIKKYFPNETIKLISLQDSADIEVLEKFAKMGLKTELKKNLTVNEAIKEIASLQYLISMRFHSALVGAKAGVKVLGINYDIKVETLAKTIGFPLAEFNENSLQDVFVKLIDYNSQIYDKIELNLINNLSLE